MKTIFVSEYIVAQVFRTLECKFSGTCVHWRNDPHGGDSHFEGEIYLSPYCSWHIFRKPDITFEARVLRRTIPDKDRSRTQDKLLNSMARLMPSFQSNSGILDLSTMNLVVRGNAERARTVAEQIASYLESEFAFAVDLYVVERIKR